jgi:type VI protein secretion system component VasF
LRFSRSHRQSDSPAARDAVPLRRLALWALAGVAIVIGLVLYFRFARLIVPLVV